MRYTYFPLLVAGLRLRDQDEHLFRDCSAHLHDMAKDCMGSQDVQLHSYMIHEDGYCVTSFSWSSPQCELSYVISIVWRKKGLSLVPEFIKYGATFDRPRQIDGVWDHGAPITMIKDEPMVGEEGTVENETMALAKVMGHERFFQERTLFPDKGDLHHFLRLIAQEYQEHFAHFMKIAVSNSISSTQDRPSALLRYRTNTLPILQRKRKDLVEPTVYIHRPRFLVGWIIDSWFAKLVRYRIKHPGPSWLV